MEFRWQINSFALFVFLVSRDCCVALPNDTMGLSAVCEIILTHLLFLKTIYFVFIEIVDIECPW